MSIRLRIIALLVLVAGVAACSSGSEAPSLTPESEAELSARGLALLCDQHCIGEELSISDHEYVTVDPPTPGDSLTDVQKTAITRQFTDVEFVADDVAQAAHDQGVFIFVVGPIEEEDNGLVRVEVSAVGPDAVFTEVFSFSWDGDSWVPASSGTNVTVSTLP
ncbi:MAG TPA: hypothetical protein VI193_09680 [Acidimicrobiia bacterium]